MRVPRPPFFSTFRVGVEGCPAGNHLLGTDPLDKCFLGYLFSICYPFALPHGPFKGASLHPLIKSTRPSEASQPD